MTRYIVVANQTLRAPALLDRLRAASTGHDASFYLVVPATPPRAGFTWTEGEARALATERLHDAIRVFRDIGLVVSGEVGDRNPVLGVEDALRHHAADVIVLSTLPAGISRWLGADLPQRMRSMFPQPVVHVVSGPSALVA